VTDLYLLRHAHAGDALAWDGPDAIRPLTDKGRQQADRLGRFLAERGLRPDAVVTSPKVRAAQTAQIVADLVRSPVGVDERLGDELDIAAVESLLRDHGDPASVMLVGHDPDLSELLGQLCGAVGVPMRKGSLARIEVSRPLRPGAGLLRWLIPPDALRTER
jgi:phosphohistidine phosphatase